MDCSKMSKKSAAHITKDEYGAWEEVRGSDIKREHCFLTDQFFSEPLSDITTSEFTQSFRHTYGFDLGFVLQPLDEHWESLPALIQAGKVWIETDHDSSCFVLDQRIDWTLLFLFARLLRHRMRGEIFAHKLFQLAGNPETGAACGADGLAADARERIPVGRVILYFDKVRAFAHDAEAGEIEDFLRTCFARSCREFVSDVALDLLDLALIESLDQGIELTQFVHRMIECYAEVLVIGE